MIREAENFFSKICRSIRCKPGFMIPPGSTRLDLNIRAVAQNGNDDAHQLRNRYFVRDHGIPEMRIPDIRNPERKSSGRNGPHGTGYNINNATRKATW